MQNHLFQYTVNREARALKNGHKGLIIWLTGLSGAGKSTIANQLEMRFHSNNINTLVLDGDSLRSGLNKNLGFSIEDRKENIRRVSEVAKLVLNAGLVVIVSLISPLEEERRNARTMFDKDEFIEVYVKCPLSECERRDPKKLYLKARSGLINNFTGIDSPYEEPLYPEITVETDRLSLDETVNHLIEFINRRELLRKQVF